MICTLYYVHILYIASYMKYRRAVYVATYDGKVVVNLIRILIPIALVDCNKRSSFFSFLNGKT